MERTLDASRRTATDPGPSIRRARPDEAATLTALARRSKASWGYDADFLARAATELTITPFQVAEHQAWVLADEGGTILGFHLVIAGDPAVLEDLWLEPGSIGQGFGQRLWEHAVAVARASGASAIELDADPNALGFYERMGAVRVGSTPSWMEPDRELPRMRLDMQDAPRPTSAGR